MGTSTRREFLVTAAAVSAGAVVGSELLRAEDRPPAGPARARRLKLGVIGVADRGLDNIKELLPADAADIVALCDVDSSHFAEAAKLAPKAEHFADFREVLKLPGLEAVLVATPDHTHAPITAAALRAGKHVYCEKPLTHTVKESRAISKLAKETGLCTQMGIQIHATDNYRRVVELVRAGAIGPVSEVHIWNNRRNHPVDDSVVPPPATLDYDLWLGPVAHLPYRKSYHPRDWRRFWTFGTGLLGDIGCHLMDVAFWALDLGHATSVECAGWGAPSSEQTPDGFEAHYEFPARGEKPAVKLSWYDPPRRPAKISEWGVPAPLDKEAILFVGEKGLLATNYTTHALLPEARFKDYVRPAQTIAHSPGHQAEWIHACLAGDPSRCGAPFAYGALLTEAAQLGTVAYRAGKKLAWDAEGMRIANAPEAEKLLDYPHREGWAV